MERVQHPPQLSLVLLTWTPPLHWHCAGTLIECAKALRDRGATKISAYVTHAVFPGEAWRKYVPPHFTEHIKAP